MKRGGRAAGKQKKDRRAEARRSFWPFEGIDFPQRSHGAAGRRAIWSKVFGSSEAQLAWWSIKGRFANIAARNLPGWRVGRDRDGRYLEREFRFGGLGEAVLWLHHLNWLQWTTNTSSRLEWKLDLGGRVSLQLRDGETDEVTIDDGLMALVVSRATSARRRKRSRLRRLLRRLGWTLGAGPARLGREALSERLAARPDWIALWREERCIGLQSAYLFSGRSAALDCACALLANLGHLWRDILCDVGVSEAIVTAVLHGDPRAWPPPELFDAADAVAELAAAVGGEAQNLSEWAENANQGS